MIVLHTDVLTNLLKGERADPGVVSWIRTLREQPVTTVISKAELLAGVALLPTGGRRANLAQAVDTALGTLDVCLPFTPEVPAVYAEVVSARRLAGHAVSASDAYVAAIARVHGAAVATRDVTRFEGIGLRVVDPWQR